MVRTLPALVTALALIIGQAAQASALYAMVSEAAPTEIGHSHCASMGAAVDPDDEPASEPCTVACDAACSAPSVAFAGGMPVVSPHESMSVSTLSWYGASRDLDVEQRPPIT
jgi:hypothetical protein